MSLISFTPVTDGSTAVAAGVNTPFSTIYNDYNGNITDANISASAAIAFSKISGGTTTALTAWQSWTPSWTNVTIGNATVVAKYVQVGKAVACRLSVIFGSTSSTSGVYTFSLPVASVAYPGTASISTIGVGTIFDVSGAAVYDTRIVWVSTTTAKIIVNVVSTYVIGANTSNTVPVTPANPDEWAAGFVYEAAQMPLDVGQIIGTDISPNANILGTQIADKTLQLRNLSDDTFGIIQTGTIQVSSLTGTPLNYATLPHGLNFAPIVLGFLNNSTIGTISTTGSIPLPTWSSVSIDTTNHVVNFATWIQIFSDATNIYGLLINSTGTTVAPLTITYYLLQESAKQ